MKKNYLFGAALMALTWTSCTQDDSLNLVGKDNSVFTGEMEFVGSRTLLDEDNKISWVLEDELSIFKKNNINRHYKVASIDNGKATFSYLDNVTPATVEAISGNYAVYPYSEDNSITTDGTISAPIKAEYTYTNRTNFISSALMAAKSTSTNFNFKNVQGYLRLRLSAVIPEDYAQVESVTLTSDSKYLNGTAKITWNEDIPVATIEDGVEANKSLTVTLSEPQSLPSKESGNYVELYLPVLPMEFPAEDIELKVTFKDGTSYTKSNSNSFTITRGEVKGMKLIISDDETFTGEIEDDIVDVFDVRTNEDFAEINGEGGLANLYVDIESSTNITFDGALQTEGKVTVDMNDNILTSGNPAHYGFIASGSEADATINNTNLVSKGGGVGVADGAKVTFNSGSLNVSTTSTSGRYLFYLEGAGSTVTINGGNFSWDSTKNQKRAYIYAGAGTTAYVTGGTFGKASTRDGYTAGILGEGTVIITGGTFGFDPTTWVADGYEAKKSGENWIVVATVYAQTADELATALKTDVKNMEVILANDIDVAITSLGQQTGGSGEYKLGGDNTQNIIIDLNGKKLNITTTYWSAIGAKNNDATITIKNGKMTSTGNSAGTWNAWDLRFSNCNYVFEDVKFEKAVALDNVEKSTKMKNVTITDNHNIDTYGLWITAEGQTVTLEDCVIDMTSATDGRGIKIDNEYIAEADQKKVTLNVKNVTFKTDEKAAILVNSVAGAEINASNLNISEVVDDSNFAVWVDEDAKAYADKVIVTGAYKVVEGTKNAVISNSTELTTATIENNSTILLGAGDYVIPVAAQGKNVTFIGTGNPADVKVAVTKVGTGGENCDYGLDGSTVTFEGITITTNSSTYIGYARCNGTYKNCIINGTYTLYDNSTFENCTFNVSGDVYNLWTWGAPTATFIKCTFNSDGKAVLLYGQANTKLTIENCTFNDNGGLTALKAAIEIGNDYGTSYELIVNNTTVNGYEINDQGINTNTTLWANKNSMGTDKLNVVVNGVDVY